MEDNIKTEKFGLNMKSDISFKAFFAKKGNEIFLKDFLESFLDMKIDTLEIKEEVNLLKYCEFEKGGRIDLQAIVNEKLFVNIEMQVKPCKDIIERLSSYAIKTSSRQNGVGKQYSELYQVVEIGILDFIHFKNNTNVINGSKKVLKEDSNEEIYDGLPIYLIELPKLDINKIDLNNRVMQWLIFLDNTEKEIIEMLETKYEIFRKARQAMNYLTGDEEQKRLEYLRERWEQDRISDLGEAKEKGKEEGREEGREEERREKEQMIVKLINMGIPVDSILQASKYSKEDIEELMKVA